MFKRELPKSLLLAGPGVLISAFLTAIMFLYVLWYKVYLIFFYNFKNDLYFSEAMVFGSILGATDPVAVISLLKVY